MNSESFLKFMAKTHVEHLRKLVLNSALNFDCNFKTHPEYCNNFRGCLYYI